MSIILGGILLSNLPGSAGCSPAVNSVDGLAADAVTAAGDGTTVNGDPTAGTRDESTRPTAIPSKSPDESIDRFVRECVRITPGTDPYPKVFVFGTGDDQEFAFPARNVAMSAEFRISQFEVTQELYQAVVHSNPSRWKGPRNSAESMTFVDATDFCRKLTAILHSRKLIDADEIVRLPTETEWEYCCRAGTTTRYSFGDSAVTETDTLTKASLLDPYAWHTGNAQGNDPAVGVLKPNAWGLYDMHGYLSEFVSDRWGTGGQAAADGTAELPKKPGAGNATEDSDAAPERQGMRVLRGGSWRDDHTKLTTTSRMPISAVAVSDAVGFRCVIAKRPQATK